MEYPVITIAIIIITVLTSYQAFQDRILKARLIFLPAKIKEAGEWYRFFSSGLIHIDWIHLGLNMYVLYYFGGTVEKSFIGLFGTAMGEFLYLFMYILSLIISSIPEYFKHQDYYGYASLGASGAVSAIVFAGIFLNPWEGGLGIIFIQISIPPMLFGILYMWYSSYMEKHNIDNIGHGAHFWGAVFGFFTTLMLVAAYRLDLLDDFLNEIIQGFIIV